MKKVLILSVDTQLINFLKRLLGEHDVECKIVQTGEKALHFMREKGALAFVVDRAVPKEDVFGLLAEKKKHEIIRKIPTFVLSCVADTEDIVRARLLGVASYSIVPHTHPEQIVGRIMSLIL